MEWKITRKKLCKLGSLYSVSQIDLIPIQTQKSTSSALTVTRKYILKSNGLLHIAHATSSLSEQRSRSYLVFQSLWVHVLRGNISQGFAVHKLDKNCLLLISIVHKTYILPQVLTRLI